MTNHFCYYDHFQLFPLLNCKAISDQNKYRRIEELGRNVKSHKIKTFRVACLKKRTSVLTKEWSFLRIQLPGNVPVKDYICIRTLTAAVTLRCPDAILANH